MKVISWPTLALCGLVSASNFACSLGGSTPTDSRPKLLFSPKTAHESSPAPVPATANRRDNRPSKRRHVRAKPKSLPRGVGPAGGAAGPFSGPTPDDEAKPTGNFMGRDVPAVNAPTLTREDRLSTFAVDVDTAAYSIARRSLFSGRMPAPTLVRVEEAINYFSYDYDAPTRDSFAIQIDGARSPVDATKHMLRVGIQSKVIEDAQRLPTNLVFLVDTSCSMTSRDKLSLVKRSMKVALRHLNEGDQVAITTYAGGTSVVLPPTPATRTRRILAAIEGLRPGGGTAMASGMTLAYRQAAKMLRPQSNTRVIVMSDGDANIGATTHHQILRKVKAEVSEGVRLSTVGYGDGNYKDEMMEQLANKGNGNYHYIDSDVMADRVFGRQLTRMLQDVAQDVKIQVEFNPASVESYRLVGYENRDIADRDFRNDRVDAGEIGAGHQVTALYELTLTDDADGDLATVRVRSKKPLFTKATETRRQVSVAQVRRPFERAPQDMRFATAVMGGAELLRNSPHAEAWTYDRVIALVSDNETSDPDRAEFVQLMKVARRLSGSRGQRISRR